VYLRHTTRFKDGKPHTYWRLVRSVRRGGKVVQETVAQLGELDAEGRAKAKALARAITGRSDAGRQGHLFEAPTTAVAVRLDRVRIERGRAFGGIWLGWQLWRALQFDELLAQLLPAGRETIAWSQTAAILAIARLCEPSSELHIAEDWYRRTALEDLIGVPSEQVYDARLYRGLDQLLPHKEAIERHLVKRLGELFGLLRFARHGELSVEGERGHRSPFAGMLLRADDRVAANRTLGDPLLARCDQRARSSAGETRRAAAVRRCRSSPHSGAGVDVRRWSSASTSVWWRYGMSGGAFGQSSSRRSPPPNRIGCREGYPCPGSGWTRFPPRSPSRRRSGHARRGGTSQGRAGGDVVAVLGDVERREDPRQERELVVGVAQQAEAGLLRGERRDLLGRQAHGPPRAQLAAAGNAAWARAARARSRTRAMSSSVKIPFTPEIAASRPSRARTMVSARQA